MKPRLLVSFICGVALNLVFFALSALVMRSFPYKDKPGMPNAFTLLLAPGLVVGSHIDHHPFWALVLALAVNTLIDGFAVFCIISLIKGFISGTGRHPD